MCWHKRIISKTMPWKERSIKKMIYVLTSYSFLILFSGCLQLIMAVSNPLGLLMFCWIMSDFIHYGTFTLVGSTLAKYVSYDTALKINGQNGNGISCKWFISVFQQILLIVKIHGIVINCYFCKYCIHVISFFVKNVTEERSNTSALQCRYIYLFVECIVSNYYVIRYILLFVKKKKSKFTTDITVP